SPSSSRPPDPTRSCPRQAATQWTDPRHVPSMGASCTSCADPARPRLLPGETSTSVPKAIRMSAPVLPTLHIRDLDVWFGTRQVLHAIDLSAQPGRRIGLVGENGSGKSTLFRAVVGNLPTGARVTGAVD